MSIKRRLSPEASREAALDAARTLLLEAGPQAVTLKAVGGRIGRTHANLLHHFGSAAGLQTALAERMANAITARIAETVKAAREGEVAPRAIVDLVFDAYGREGGAALASWAILNDRPEVLAPVLSATHRLIDQLGPHNGKPVQSVSLMLALTALGDALMGGAMAAELGLSPDTARTIATAQLFAFAGVAKSHENG